MWLVQFHPAGAPVSQGRAVEDEEPPVLGVVRMEGKAQQTALVEVGHQGHDPVAQVEEGLRLELSVGQDHPDQSALVDDEQPAAAVRRLGEGHRRGEAGGDLPQTDSETSRPGLALGRGCESDDEENGEQREGQYDELLHG